ncbi:MazG family protein [Naasia lichenicola]|uniref:MazG family protein n=1 Tax=Naasia lichenicola TaxID=2565933 RepID=A0A4S4FFJ7_9MICO|nr:MazG family protein [Naasia lichenicola]THG28404.1 MazG family protein [Naasia lichenicola]
MSAGLDELVSVMHRLRAECAWDAEQTHESLVPYLIEESAELVDAIEAGDPVEVREELGDVLYQVLFHADIAAEHDGYDIDDVARTVAEKMRRRHPHVFGESSATTTDEIREQWLAIKKVEKSERTSVLDGIPKGLPALALADKVLGRAAQAGLLTADDAISAKSLGFENEDELGPMLMAIVMSAKTIGVDAERALRNAVRALSAEIRAEEPQL